MIIEITLDSCKDCQYLGHGGGFGRIAYIPQCNKTARQLPFEVSRTGAAHYTGEIPEWCPLRKFEVKENK